MEVCPLDITYCSNVGCPFKGCGRHPAVLQEVWRFHIGATVSVADLSGTCRDYIGCLPKWLPWKGGKAKMDRCPHCGSDAGLFSKETARYEQYYKFNGKPDGYSDLNRVCERKTTPLYCINCEKRFTMLEKLEEGETG